MVHKKDPIRTFAKKHWPASGSASNDGNINAPSPLLARAFAFKPDQAQKYAPVAMTRRKGVAV